MIWKVSIEWAETPETMRLLKNIGRQNLSMARSRMSKALLVLLISIGSLQAQSPKLDGLVDLESKGFDWQTFRKGSEHVSSSKPTQGVGELLHYQLDLDFTEGLLNNSPLYSGRERITWKPNDDGLIILAGAENLRIDSVISSGQRLSLSPPEEPGMVIIVLPVSLRNQDSLLVDIWYAHTSAPNRGYYYYDKNTSGSENQWTLERLGYTFTEPYDSPYWFPCINDPSVKVPCSINIRVPQGYLAASNGLLKQTTDNGDGTLTFQWEEPHPIAMYLMVVTISKYSTFSHFYHRVSNPSDSVEIKYYVWQADSAGQTYNAVSAFRNVVDMMTFFSTTFGEYPFDKYGMAAVFPFGAGGMEHQTMTTIHRRWLANGGSQAGIAHELAHQWWGDMVTCAAWADIWLNEGFATYSEALWEEHFYGEQTFLELMANIQPFTDVTRQYAMYSPPTQYLFAAPLVYYKGAWVLHMLRRIVGDLTFYGILKEYRKRHEYESATTGDFAEVASSVAGTDLGWFFDQWVYGRGWPIYAYGWGVQPGGNGYEVTVDIQQQQDEDVFQMPVQLKLQGGGKDTLVVAENTTRSQSFSFVIPFRPDTVYFDPGGWILKQLSPGSQSAVGSGNELPRSFLLYQNYPNPFNPATVIRYYLPVSGTVSLKVFDLLGQEASAVVNELEAAGFHQATFDGKRLTSGVYFYRLMATPLSGTTTSYVDTKRMLLLK
jgi:aminopeptidase N